MTLKSPLKTLTRFPSALRRVLTHSPLGSGLPAAVALGLYFLITALKPELDFSSQSPEGMRDSAMSIESVSADRLSPFSQLLESTAPRVQAYATAVTTQRFDENGKLQNSVDAATQLQIGESLVLLERPVLRFYSAGIEEWSLHSNLGRLRRSTAQEPDDTLELLGAAELNASEQNDSDLRLSAPTLLVDPERETVSTSQRVELIDTGLTQTAQGFDANLQTDTMQFHSAVRGSYAPQTKN